MNKPAAGGSDSYSCSAAASRRESRIARVVGFLERSAVEFEVRRLADNTATAVQAAAALSCEVAEIAKSVVFRQPAAQGTSECAADIAVVCILCGDDRVDTKRLSALTGAPIQKADADFVKTQCGFEIGGVAPVAHQNTAQVFLEARLQRFPLIWAAAGSAYAVFSITPADLAHCTNTQFSDFAA